VLIHTISQPWTAALSQSEYLLTFYFLALTALVFLAAFLRAWTTKTEIGSRYRGVTVARLGILGVTLIAYLFLLLHFFSGYTLVGGMHQPNSDALLAFAPRYIEWSVAVPLLTAALLAACTLTGATARRTLALAMGGAFLMIFTGYIGGVVIEDGENLTAVLSWGGVSSAFWIGTNIVLIRAVKQSLPKLTPEAAFLLRQATILLLSCWVIYVVIYLIPIFFSGGAWATTIQIALCVTDMTVKVAFGTLLWRVAKLRTAEDVRAGEDIHPESIWISSVKLSDAGIAGEVYLNTATTIHPRRAKPPSSEAVATPPHPRKDSDTDTTTDNDTDNENEQYGY
jgi:bacteriorhodopsin